MNCSKIYQNEGLILKIKAIKIHTQLNQTELAYLLNIRQNTLSRYENRKMFIPYNVGYEISLLYNTYCQ